MINVFYWICIFLCANYSLTNVTSASELTIFEDADKLLEEGKYFEAAVSFERIYFTSEDSQSKIIANLKRTEALKQLGEYSKARNDLQRSVHVNTYADLHQEVLYQMAFCDYMDGNYVSSRVFLLQIEHYYPVLRESNEVERLLALVNVMLGQWEQASLHTLSLIEKSLSSQLLKDSLSEETDNLFCSCNWPVEKSEKKAGMLSTFLPGTGHVYAGYPGKGILNAGSQLLSLSFAGVMMWQGLYITGFTVGLGLFQSFYFGGIRQANFLTHQSNLVDFADYKERLSLFIFSIENFQE